MPYLPPAVFKQILQMRRELHLPDLWRKEHKEKMSQCLSLIRLFGKQFFIPEHLNWRFKRMEYSFLGVFKQVPGRPRVPPVITFRRKPCSGFEPKDGSFTFFDYWA